ncbi:restriction endonuclease subunit S [Streptococcus orisasini]
MKNIKIPNFRFKNFDEEWKNDELNKFAQLNPKSDLPEQFEYVDLESVIGTELISHRTEKKKTAPSRAQRLAKKGDVFYQMVRPYQKNNYLFDLDKKDYVFSTGYAQLRPTDKLESDFLLASLQIDKFVSRVLDRSTGTSYPAINSKDLSKLTINIPSLPEQSAIGSLFQTLDELLSAYKDNLANYQAFKASMLSKMFPKAGQTIPEIRLDGFDSEWEEKRIGDVISISAGGDVDKSKLSTSGKFPVVANALTNKGIVGYYDDYKIDAPAVTVTGRGDVGFAVARHENFTPIVRLLTLKSENFDVDFLQNRINSMRIYNESTGVPQLTAPQLGAYFISYPSIEEQKEMGTFFTNLDNLIETYQEKIDQLETLKKKLLKDMFI